MPPKGRGFPCKQAKVESASDSSISPPHDPCPEHLPIPRKKGIEAAPRKSSKQPRVSSASDSSISPPHDPCPEQPGQEYVPITWIDSTYPKRSPKSARASSESDTSSPPKSPESLPKTLTKRLPAPKPKIKSKQKPLLLL
jgi:hypothetical protein